MQTQLQYHLQPKLSEEKVVEATISSLLLTSSNYLLIYIFVFNHLPNLIPVRSPHLIKNFLVPSYAKISDKDGMTIKASEPMMGLAVGVLTILVRHSST